MVPHRSARLEVTSAPTALAVLSFSRQRRKASPLGLILAVVALLAQIAGPSLHVPASVGSANSVATLTIAFDEHALCLAPPSTAPGPPAPTDQAPKAKHDFAACCLWHGAPGAALAPAALVEPVVFAAFRVVFTAAPAGIPNRLFGTVRARAPPAGA